jgi:hypothetical protein
MFGNTINVVRSILRTQQPIFVALHCTIGVRSVAKLRAVFMFRVTTQCSVLLPEIIKVHSFQTVEVKVKRQRTRSNTYIRLIIAKAEAIMIRLCTEYILFDYLLNHVRQF